MRYLKFSLSIGSTALFVRVYTAQQESAAMDCASKVVHEFNRVHGVQRGNGISLMPPLRVTEVDPGCEPVDIIYGKEQLTEQMARWAYICWREANEPQKV